MSCFFEKDYGKYTDEMKKGDNKGNGGNGGGGDNGGNGIMIEIDSWTFFYATS